MGYEGMKISAMSLARTDVGPAKVDTGISVIDKSKVN